MYLFPPLLLELPRLPYFSWVSYSQRRVGSWILIHSTKLCLSVGAFRPFSVDVIVGILGLLPLPFYYLFSLSSFTFSFHFCFFLPSSGLRHHLFFYKFILIYPFASEGSSLGRLCKPCPSTWVLCHHPAGRGRGGRRLQPHWGESPGPR